MSKVTLCGWLTSAALEQKNNRPQMRLKFSFDDDNNCRDKLVKLCGNDCGITPYGENGFNVLCTDSLLFPYIEKNVSLFVNIKVILKYYSFESQYEKNKGEKVTGISLIIKEIST